MAYGIWKEINKAFEWKPVAYLQDKYKTGHTSEKIFKKA